MIWVTRIQPHGKSAKTCGLITGNASGKTGNVFVVSAPTKELALSRLHAEFAATDARPLSGASYLRAWRVKMGQRVYIVGGWRIGYDKNGFDVVVTRGTVTEVLGDMHCSIHPDGYHNKHVDFYCREIVPVKHALPQDGAVQRMDVQS